ncbi:MAG: S-layer homology domain-containing protein [Oscillospiraceae bacterium]|nr:S-layer homology domain-containing protein [Oscillospiraceae bacterium]
MGGYNDGTFRPGANTTRQALWMVLGRIDGAGPATMADARTWAIRNGVSDGSSPNGGMTRQQMVTMLYRYAQMKGYNTTGGVSLNGFSDAAGVADYAQEAMGWAVGNGIVQGTASGALNPGGIASRAHFAAFLHRFCTAAGIA